MKSLLKSLVVIFVLCITVNVSGQIKVDLKKKVESKVNQRVNQRTDQAINKGLDAVEDGIKNSGKEKEGEEPREESGNDGQKAAKSGKEEVKGNASAATPFETYSKYDFIPGEKVIFYEDFSQDAVGDFPALWNTNGSAEVVTTNLFPGKWMSFMGDKCVWTDELLNLPENYTVEFDIIPTKGEEGQGMAGYSFRLYQSINAKGWDAGAVPGKSGFNFFVEYFGRPGYRTYINSTDGKDLGLRAFKDGDNFKEKIHQKYHIAIWVQKSRVRLYQDQDKLFDLPKAFPLSHVKFDRLRFESGAAMISNIRVAVGAPDMRNKLMTEGKLVTYGIYFDVNKDVVKPESYGTLKEIAAILNEVPDVKVKIVGHTDSDGADAANLELSKNRAASVKNELAKSFGVNADRLVTEGAGETQPVAANDSQANKALNRRVEFIKL
jgi:OmpA-OmpF porin, OOP family